MNIKQPPRKINRNIFFGKLHLNGLTLKAIGQQLVPPVTKSRVCQIINKGAPTNRLQQIAAVLKSNITTLFPKI